jgi:uracil-DNA glycosylase
VVEAAVAATEALSLSAYRDEVAACTRCALAKGRTQVVFGSGSPTADLMFVGEAPGFHEDKQGVPFVGQAGKLLEALLGEIGLTRDDVYIANVLKCRPPGNRDPLPDEIESCQGHLFTQIQLIRPAVICTLGNFSTKLLSGSPLGITRVRGRPQPHTFGAVSVQLYPIYHPAAALYTPAMLEMLRSDFGRIPGLLSGSPPAPEGKPEPQPELRPAAADAEPLESQLSFQF